MLAFLLALALSVNAMAIPIFTRAPQWLQLPAGAPPYFPGNVVNLDNILQNYGPFVRGSDTYYIALEAPGPYQIVAYKNTDGITSQPLARIVSPFTTRSTSDTNIGLYWDGSSDTVYLAWVTQAKNLYTSTFTLSTGAFGPLNDTGLVLAKFPTSVGILVPSNGKVYVLWDDTDPTWQMNAVVFSAGVWGGIITSATTQQYLCVSIVSASTIGVLSGKIYAVAAPGETPTPIAYSLFDGTAFTLKISSTVPTYISGTGHNPSLYDSVHDQFIGVLADNTNNGFDAINVCAYTVNPSDGSGGVITRTVVFNDPVDDYGLETFALIADRTFSNFYIYGNSGVAPHLRQIQGFSATSPTGAWTGPVVAYDNDTNNSTPPGNLDVSVEIIAPFQVVSLLDGRTSLLMGWFAQNGTSSTAQGGVALFAPGVPLLTNPGPAGRRPMVLTPNQFDFCIHRENRLYCSIDIARLTCGNIPACFTVDEREWGAAS